jgi:hypothetical protein
MCPPDDAKGNRCFQNKDVMQTLSEDGKQDLITEPYWENKKGFIQHKPTNALIKVHYCS